MSNGKGDTYRPVDKAKYDAAWDRIYGNTGLTNSTKEVLNRNNRDSEAVNKGSSVGGKK